MKKLFILLMLTLSLASCYKVGIDGASAGKVNVKTEKRFFALFGLVPYQNNIKCAGDIATVQTKMGFVDYLANIGAAVLTFGVAPLVFNMTTVEYACTTN